jgi:hypothetical protein
MENKKFIFFGCSWTYGKFINIAPGQLPKDVNVNEERSLADVKSYRALISNFFEVDHLNFAEGGSSNDRQFRRAAEYFIGPKRKNAFLKEINFKKYEKIRDQNWPTTDELRKKQRLPNWIVKEMNEHLQNSDFDEFCDDEEYVLWFITSTARKEFYNASIRQFQNEMLNNAEIPIMKSYTIDYYDHEHELERTAQQMVLWNSYFKANNIKNLWIDTFNHHDYPIEIANLLTFDSGLNDLMSNMCVSNGFVPTNLETHLSAWAADEERSKFLTDKGLLTNQTIHPNVSGHKLIAEMLIPKIQKHFNL